MSEIENGHIFLINKPYRYTSQDVVGRVKYTLKKSLNRPKLKVGHAGTLDPLATGLLIVCVGKATKMAEQLQAEKKEYVAEFTIGATTPSFDREHPINEVFTTEDITLERVEWALEQLRQQREQMPPSYSAKSINGVRAYDLARKGREAELKPSAITIYDIELLAYYPSAVEPSAPSALERWLTRPPYRDENNNLAFEIKKRGYCAPVAKQSDDELQEACREPITPEFVEALPRVVVRIECSKGTYIRSLARDFGELLGSGAYMSALCRTRSGGYRVEDALSLDDLLGGALDNFTL